MKSACLAALALALAACGPGQTFCQSKKALLDTTSNTKLKDCPDIKTLYDASSSQMPTGQACEDIYAKCTAADKTALDASSTCLKALPNCALATASDWVTAALACNPTGLSADCKLGY
jgi:hypothetical protein